MDYDSDIAFEYFGFRMYKSGRFERFVDPTGGFVPPGVDPITGVISKDVTISDGTVSARLFLPAFDNGNYQKLPVLVYFHGGGFFMGSAFSPFCHNYLNSIVAKCNVMAVSVEYRIAPEHPVPSCYEDCYTALTWVLSSNSDEWIKSHGDLNRVVIAGDSAGGNIAHNIAMRVGNEDHAGVRLNGMVLLFPYFWGSERVEGQRKEGVLKFEWLDSQWLYLCPSAKENGGNDDPRINPTAEIAPGMDKLGCNRVLVIVGELDSLCAKGKEYAEKLRGRSKWEGTVELVEYAGEDHCFHAYNLESDKATDLMERLVKFVNAA